MLTTYNSWNLKLPIIPTRSHLYQIKPIGIGTLLVESLTGYLSRLAEVHCLPPGILMERKLTSLIQKNYGGANLHRIYQYTGALNGTGVMAMDLVEALQALTLRDDLKYLTMLSWSELFPSRNLLRSVRSWCPFCYQEWHLSKQIIYEPLLWTLDVVKICPKHQQPLHQICSHCGQSNYPLAWRSQPGYCSKCFEWLGLPLSNKLCDSQDSAPELEFKIWIANAVGELFVKTPCLTFLPSKETIAKALYAYAQELTQGNIAAFARLLQMPRNTVWLWCQGKNLPSIEALVKICYCLRISLVDLLTQRVESLEYNQTIKLLPGQLQSKLRVSSQPFDTNKVRQDLEAVVASNESPPPSMEEVARRFKCNRRTIYKHFPDLCSAISAKYITYKKTSKLNTIEESCKEVQQIAFKLYNDGEYPTENRISELMSKPGYFRYKKVRASLSEARRELGL
ncbi:MAG: helix-turn-helix domain-containing protein [Aulosira sp. DedQUE10]|nr:helix-turn-helix domain-containing protein [Aulosira sp. DedQUE10]